MTTFEFFYKALSEEQKKETMKLFYELVENIVDKASLFSLVLEFQPDGAEGGSWFFGEALNELDCHQSMECLFLDMNNWDILKNLMTPLVKARIIQAFE